MVNHFTKMRWASLADLVGNMWCKVGSMRVVIVLIDCLWSDIWLRSVNVIWVSLYELCKRTNIWFLWFLSRSVLQSHFGIKNGSQHLSIVWCHEIIASTVLLGSFYHCHFNVGLVVIGSVFDVFNHWSVAANDAKLLLEVHLWISIRIGIVLCMCFWSFRWVLQKLIWFVVDLTLFYTVIRPFFATI